MAFPPFPAGAIDGLGVYVGKPEVLDKSERGVFTGRRRETITYVCKRPGRFIVPAVRLTWWDVRDQALRTIDLPEHVIDVAGATSAPTATRTGGKPPWSRKTIVMAGGLVAAGCGAALVFVRGQVLRKLVRYFEPIHLAELNPGTGDVAGTTVGRSP
jgi:hypothetical protein